MNAILFGFKGSGKTHFGQLLSQKLGKKWIDTDQEIEKRMGTGTIRQIYASLGEEKFRAIEKEVIQSLIGVTDTVISLGGGVVLDLENREILKKIGQLIYLEASFELLQKRIDPGYAPIDQVRKMYHDRYPIYQTIPARRINVELMDEAGVLAELESILYLEEPPDGL